MTPNQSLEVKDSKVLTNHDLRAVLCEVGLESLFPKRFLLKIRVDSVGCWIWTGAKKSNPRYPEHKYGQFSLDGTPHAMMSAHKYAFELVHGKVPAGFELDHTCEIKLCVNPSHLQLVTHQQNCAKRKRSGPLPGFKMVNGKKVTP